jgi:5'-methylthioadenosine phosphorylase
MTRHTGTSLDGSSLFSHLPLRVISTKSGAVSVATDGSTIAFVRRHHSAPSDGGASSSGAGNPYQQPDKISYSAIASALRSLGVTHVIAACSVGALKPILSVGSLVVPSDYFAPWCCVSVHADKRAHIVPQLDPHLRSLLLDAARCDKSCSAVDGGVYVQTQGPRFETKAEISFLQGVGDVVGMTGAVEAAMMQEVGLAYAMICCVDNMAHGVASPSAAPSAALTLSSFTATAAANRPSIELVMSRAIALLTSQQPSPPAPSPSPLAPCDIMIHCGIVLPVLPHRVELRNHSIIIRGNSISDLLPTPEALSRYSAAAVSDLRSHIVMPGLVNLHTHAAMKLMKGVGSDVQLMPWLQRSAPSHPASTHL